MRRTSERLLRDRRPRFFWQTALDRIAKKYTVKPRFSQSEKDTLKRMGVTEPDVPSIGGIIGYM